MLAQSVEELVGRLNAQRQVLALLLACMRVNGGDCERLLAVLDELCISDQQEDPGAVPTAAFAIEGTRIVEIRQILEEAEAVVGRLEDLKEDRLR